MSRGNWCINCGRRIDVGQKVCPYCGTTQRKDNNPFNTETKDLSVVIDRYKDLVYKHSTDHLDYEEMEEMVKLSEYIKHI